MKVLVVSDLEKHGGASIACRNLLKGLQNRIEARHLWLSKPTGPVQKEDYPGPPPPPGISDYFTIRRCGRALLQWWNLRKTISRFRPDLINLHNLHGTAIPHLLLTALPKHIPIVWTLHDEWSFTGRCAYTLDCPKFRDGCDHLCPTPGEYPSFPPNLIYHSWKTRKRFFAEHQIFAACPSEWLARQAASGFWDPQKISVIRYGMDLNMFLVGDRQAARARFGIPNEASVLLSMAVYVQDPRKGYSQLVSALRQISKPTTILAAGRMSLTVDNPKVNVIHIGYLDNDETKVAAYQASDALLHPAIMDNLPLTVMEATACGIPTVAFHAGGVPEMIVDGETGVIAHAMTGEDFANAINRLQQMEWDAQHIRGFAEKNYDADRQTREYLDLFERVLRTSAVSE